MNGLSITRTTLAGLAFALLIAAGVQAQDAGPGLDDDIAGMDAAGNDVAEGSVVDRFASDFETFAGSSENAGALVRGLRSGSELTLARNGDSTSFTPATGHLGYGGVYISLSLAKALLERDGITEPTPAQIAAALNGGDVTLGDGTVVTYAGILAQRADGAGWGQIAKAEGFKLGPVIATLRSGKDHLSRHAARPGKPDHAGGPKAGERAERAAKPQRAERAERPEKPQRAERPEKPERPMRVERPERPERPDRPGKS